jgi:carbon-monoxide dehydrogenase medium subunit
MYPFAYQRARSIAQARQMKSAHAQAKYLAGGMSLLPAMKLRLSAPDALVDLQDVPELAGIHIAGDRVRIGAMTRHHAVAAHAELAGRMPVLCLLAGGIGDVQVRYRGTIGGSVANADPASDYPAAVLGLGARIVTDRREIAADDFFLGMFQTALDEGELVTAFDFPLVREAVYLKFANMASRFALVGLFLARVDGRVRLAVTGASGCVFRLRRHEAALQERFHPQAIEHLPVDPTDLLDDIHASAAYRAHLIGVLARRAVEQLLQGQS